MSAYLYANNVSPRDRFQQVTINLDNGSAATIRRGSVYDLSATEAARARQYVVLVPSAGASQPLQRVSYLPVVGNIAEGQVPLWDESLGAFVPGDVTGGSGGGGGITISDLAPALTDVVEDPITGWPSRPTIDGQPIPWPLRWRSQPGSINNPVDLMAEFDTFLPVPGALT